MRVFISLLVLCLAIAVGQACHDVRVWSYPPPGGQVYNIYGLKFKSEGPNSAAFKLYVHGSFGKRECANFAIGELKPSGDSITAYCKNYPVEGQYLSIETTGLTICGDTMDFVAAYTPCPANSKREGSECKCDDGYKRNGDNCSESKKCPANSRNVEGECHCHIGYQLIGEACLQDCPAGHKRSGSDCIRLRDTCGGLEYFYCHRARRDCPGHDIRYLRTNFHECKRLCDKDCRCKSIQHRSGHCWLKSYACPRPRFNLFAHDHYKRVRGQHC